MFNTKCCGFTKINTHSLHQRRSFMGERSYGVCSGITARLFICVSNNNQSLNADLYSQQLQCMHENHFRNASHSAWTMKGKFKQISLTSSTIFIRSCTKKYPSFSSLQNALNYQTISQEEQIKKNLWKNSLIWNQPNFTWEWSTSYRINGKRVSKWCRLDLWWKFIHG